jgi:hypothetical protein
LPDVADKQADRCDLCPQNVKGSSLTDDGRKSRACSYYKRLVVTLPTYPEYGPLVADIKAMSLFGESNPDANQWNLKTYFRRILTNGAKPYQVVTQVEFDTDESVPKLFFGAKAFVDEDTYRELVEPLVFTPDGQLQLTELADTSKVRTGDDDSAGGATAMKDQLLDGPKPAHLEDKSEPEPEPEPAKPKVTKKKVAKKVEAKPEPEPEAEEKEAPSEMEQALADLGF